MYVYVILSDLNNFRLGEVTKNVSMQERYKNTSFLNRGVIRRIRVMARKDMICIFYSNVMNSETGGNQIKEHRRIARRNVAKFYIEVHLSYISSTKYFPSPIQCNIENRSLIR